MMRLVVILAAAAALGACQKREATPPAGEPNAEQGSPAAGESKSIKPPTPEGVALRVTADDEGDTVKVRVGTKFAVELRGVPTAGYVWEAAEIPAFLAAAGTTSGPTSTDQLQPGFAGGSHWEVLIFEATAAGTGALRLVQRQPWAPADEPPADEFAITVEASAE
jgi:predicted secreted protein